MLALDFFYLLAGLLILNLPEANYKLYEARVHLELPATCSGNSGLTQHGSECRLCSLQLRQLWHADSGYQISKDKIPSCFGAWCNLESISRHVSED
jgi:hypothetical protein